MNDKAKMDRLYWIHAVTPLHVGSGRGVGYIDLPIAREKVTNWPTIPGSAVKGVVAERFGASQEDKRKNDPLALAAFGAANEGDTTEANSSAGSLVFTDARIVCLPVRSFYGTFAWVTSPFCLERLKRDVGLDVPSVETKDALVTSGTRLVREDAKLYLEDLDLPAKKDERTDAWAKTIAKAVFASDADWQKIFCERFAAVSDDVFTFLCEAGTEVNARIRIDEEKGTVAKGALWYEESLPVETLLAGTVWCDRVYKQKKHTVTPTKEELLKAFCTAPLDLQIGGKASTGKGRIRCLFEAR